MNAAEVDAAKDADAAVAKPPEAAASQSSAGYRTYVLVILIIVYTFNFLDRQVLGILAPAIKADLHLTDTQLGLMGGLAFALFYTLLGIPIGWLADRWNRTWIMTIALTLWSTFTALCGLAGSFGQLFLMRMGVGFGEAGGTAPAYSLVGDYFPVKSRARALAAYSFGIPIGSAIGILFGGLIASHINWRVAFFIIGIAGVVLAPIFKLTVKEPPRQVGRVTIPLLAALGKLARNRSFWGLSLGSAMAGVCNYGLMFWLPSFFLRSFHFTLTQTSLYFGSIILVGGVAGIWGGGWLGDRLGAAGGRKPYVLAPAAAFLISAPLFFLAVISRNPVLTFFLMLPPYAMSLMFLGPAITAIQHMAPASMRATASAAYIFLTNVFGLGCGALFFGVVSDVLTERFGTEALRYSILTGLIFFIVAAGILFATARTIDKDWVD